LLYTAVCHARTANAPHRSKRAPMKLLYPRAEKYLDASKGNAGHWDGTFAGKRVTLVDNGRPNADKVLALIERELVHRFGIEPTWIRKIDHGKPGMGGWTVIPLSKVAPDLQSQTDMVITGLGT
jgi:hypothetical protein